MKVQIKAAKKAGQLISTQAAEELIRNYKKERWEANTQRIGKSDSLSVWYSVEELEDFITKIKEAGGDGVKMHYGVYSADFNKKPEYAGRQTVVMLGTKTKEVNGQSVNKNIYLQTESGSSLLAYNMGTLCPPFCGGSDGESIGINITDKGEKGICIG
jgi:DhnA family fructose-bisphosphate aldolase class Ia